MMAAPGADEFTKRMFGAVNGMLLDVLAATARKDYDDRRRRQAQGIMKAKDAGKFKGRAENVERNAGIAAMLRKGVSWNEIQDATDCNHRQDRRPSEGRRVNRPGRCDRGHRLNLIASPPV
jgi:DNA invertase Pin-like site-specific DNA recombinase